MESDTRREFDILFSKYLENKCTVEEKRKLLDLFSSPENDKSHIAFLLSHLDKFQEIQPEDKTVDFENIYRKLLSDIEISEGVVSEQATLLKSTRIRRIAIQVAAAAAVLCIGFFIGTVSAPAGKTIAAEPALDAAPVEIHAPLGARSEVRLNDGTLVLLNAGSSIKYCNDYNISNRNLELEGEAYFKVAKNTELPLVVNAGNINIKATGTEFNVKAYSEEGIIETTLVNGEVEISQKGNDAAEKVLILKPSQKAIYAEQSDQLTIEKIREIEPQAVKTVVISTDNLLLSAKTDVEQVTAWTKNKLIIRSENLESLCVKLERKYNITFVFMDEALKKHRFSGVLLDETFQQVMDVIKLTAPVDYIMDKKTVCLFSKSDKPDNIPSTLKN